MTILFDSILPGDWLMSDQQNECLAKKLFYQVELHPEHGHFIRCAEGEHYLFENLDKTVVDFKALIRGPKTEKELSEFLSELGKHL